MKNELEIETKLVSYLRHDPNNARKHDAKNIDAIAKSLERFGQRKPIVIRGDGTIVAGNGTVEAAKQLGWTEIACALVPWKWTPEEVKAYALADNRTAELAEWDATFLAEQLLELDAVGWDVSDLGFEPLHPPTDGEPLAETISLTLAERFLVPPFSIFDQRSGRWQARKRAWMDLGIESETGRGENLLGFSGGINRQYENQKKALTIPSLSGRVPDYYTQKKAIESQLGHEITNKEFEEKYLEIEDGGGLSSGGTSVFDPVLTELMISWFSPPGSQIFDPFAGGSVRGIVSATLGRNYLGVELRSEQVLANMQQAVEILPKIETAGESKWIQGDSLQVIPDLDVEADMIISCPPYADLEVYSDDPADISNMAYPDFLKAYRAIIHESVKKLKQDRFIAWVVGDVRDKKGIYRGFVPDTIRAFEDAGASYYNEGILVSPIGSLALRLNRQFLAGRKFGKGHQNVLVFVKGDGKKATTACGFVEIADFDWLETNNELTND
jgi:hypothetical protein